MYFVNELRAIFSDDEKYVICVIPKHTIGTAPSGIRTIAKRLCKPPIIDGTDVIVRVKEIPQKAFGGKRDIKSEIESLSLKNESIIKDQQVLLLDDVTTSVSSLKAGKNILENAGAKLVAMYALGLTQFIRNISMKPISILALRQIHGVGIKTVEKILSLNDILEPTCPHDLIEIISRESSHYPECLSMIADPPVLLHVKGNIDAINKDSIAIVGTRKPSDFGKTQAKKMAGFFAKEGYVVISGLAVTCRYHH